MENYSFILSIIAISISMISLYLSWKNYTSRQKWNVLNYNQKKDEDYRKWAQPYTELINDTYYDVKDVFSELSSKANKIFNEVTLHADRFDNGHGTRTQALRHHLVYAIDETINFYAKDILFQNPIALFQNIMSKYSKIHYMLDLKEQANINEIDNHLKILYECIDNPDRIKYSHFAEDKMSEFYKVCINYKNLIDEKIKILEKKYAKFKRYDFGNTYDSLHQDFNELLNLLRYIEYVSKDHFLNHEEGAGDIALSNVFFNLLKIMVVNRGILEISRLR